MRTLVLSALLPVLLAGCAVTPEPQPPEPQPPDAVAPVVHPVRDVDPIIDRIVATYGGPPALRSLAESRAIGSVTTHIRDMGGPGHVEREFSAPDRLRVEIEYPEKTEIRVLAGERAWRGNAPTITPVAGPPKVAMQYQLLRLRPAWTLSHYRDRVVLGEDVVRDRAPHRTLTLKWSSELSIDFLVDAEAHRITHVSARLRFGTTTLSFATHYSEFQFIDGVLIPFKEESYASNRRTATTRIQSIELGAQDLGPFSISP